MGYQAVTMTPARVKAERAAQEATQKPVEEKAKAEATTDKAQPKKGK